MIEYIFGKYYRRVAQQIANKYQTQTFEKYVKKYMKKHCKLRRINKETIELNDLIVRNKDEFNDISNYITKHIDDICNDLVNFYCNKKPLISKYLLIYKPQYKEIRDRLDETCLTHIINKYPIHSNYDYIVKDIVEFASKLRMGFSVSDITAKTKIREHWIERAPILLLFTFFILSFKMITYVKDIILFHADIWTAVDIFLSFFTFITALYMVYLRVPQSICADANKAASEIYFNSKIELHHSLLMNCDNDIINTYNNELLEIICIQN